MKKKLIRFVCFVFVSLLSVQFFCVSSFAEQSNFPDTSNAVAVGLYNLNTESFVYKQSEKQTVAPGGTVKMMTGLLACEILAERLNEKLTLTSELLDGADGFKIKLTAGMSVSVQDLLYGVLCGGGNDAAIVVSKLCSESVESFVELMNDRAAQLGMTSTHYKNPTGLDDEGMTTTVADIVKLATVACNNELYLNISSVSSYTIFSEVTGETLKIFNRNALISNFYAWGYTNPNAYGLIAGNTDDSGYCVVTYSERNGTSYVCAVMGGTSSEEEIFSYKIANELLDLAFEQYVYKKIASRDTLICSVSAKYVMPEDDGTPVKIYCYIKEDVYALTYRSVNVEKDLKYRYYFHRDELAAPIREGEILGGVDILYEDEVIGSTYLYAGTSVEPSGLLYRIDQLRAFFTSIFFITSLVSCAILISIYVFFFEYGKRRFLLKLGKKGKKRKPQ